MGQALERQAKGGLLAPAARSRGAMERYGASCRGTDQGGEGLLPVSGFVVVPMSEVWMQGSVTCFLRVLCR